MKHKYSFLLAVALICSTMVLVSCRSARVRRTSSHKREHVYVQGPPPHAPAHGYRHKHQGVELVYDSGLGVYVVVELADHFYFKGHYYRHGETQWEIGVHVGGPWKVIAEKSLPKGLRGRQKGKVKGKPKGPPPHAPAHGYRHKHQDHGVELVYDSGLGVYVVVELPNHFYFEGHYYRHGETQWEIGVHVDGPWEVIAEKSLPKGLRGKRKGKGKPKEHPGKGLGLGKNKNK